MSRMSRPVAVKNSLPRYFGKVCAAHPALDGERYTASYGCVQCSVEAVKRNQNKDRAVVHARNKQYRIANPDKIRQMHQDWRAANAEHDSARKQTYRTANADKVKAAYKKYYTANYPKMLAKRNKQHADKLQRTPAWLTVDDLWMIEQAYELAATRTELFGFVWHVDHVVPMRGKLASGFHTPFNLQVIPATENLRKGNRMEA